MHVSPKPRLQLLVRVGCHLCLDAAQMLVNLGVFFERLDVDACAQLREEFGALLPVLRDRVSGLELVYPFAEKDVRQFLSHCAFDEGFYEKE